MANYGLEVDNISLLDRISRCVGVYTITTNRAGTWVYVPELTNDGTWFIIQLNRVNGIVYTIYDSYVYFRFTYKYDAMVSVTFAVTRW